MEEFIDAMTHISDAKIIFKLCGLFIFTDILTGYVKAFKNKKVNSSISRDGYVKKIGWIIAILFGFFIKKLVGVEMFLVGSAIICIATEGMSIYENFGEIGLKLGNFKKYFEKLNKENKEGEKNE